VLNADASARRAHGGLRALHGWLRGWWLLLHFAAQIGVLALAPSSYRAAQRRRMAHSMYLATRPLLPGFTLLASLVALVVIRIVLATSLSYGLSRYALDVLIRTLVLELIPLSAALFVAVRYSLAAGDVVRQMRLGGRFETLLRAGFDPTRDEVLPRALAGTFAVLTLALVSSAVTLVLAYLSVYGFATWGMAGFTRTVGQVIDPVIALIFTLKTFFLAVAVAVVPMVATPRESLQNQAEGELTRLARLLALVLLIELGALVGNYY